MAFGVFNMISLVLVQLCASKNSILSVFFKLQMIPQLRRRIQCVHRDGTCTERYRWLSADGVNHFFWVEVGSGVQFLRREQVARRFPSQ